MKNALQKIRPTINTNRLYLILLGLRSLPPKKAFALVAALAITPVLLIGTLRFLTGGGGSKQVEVASAAGEVPVAAEAEQIPAPAATTPAKQTTTVSTSAPAAEPTPPSSAPGASQPQAPTTSSTPQPTISLPQPQPEIPARTELQSSPTRSATAASPITRVVSVNATQDPQPRQSVAIDETPTPTVSTKATSITKSSNDQSVDGKLTPTDEFQDTETEEEEEVAWAALRNTVITAEERKLRKFRRIEASIAKAPHDTEKARKYGAWLTQLGEYERGERFYLWYLNSRPLDAQAFFGLGQNYEQAQQWKNACKAYYRTAELDPKHELARVHMAWILASCPDATVRDGAVAVALAKEANDLLEWPKPEIADVLAAALAETGDFEAAIRVQKWAIRSAPKEARRPMEQRLELYRHKHPYRFQYSEP